MLAVWLYQCLYETDRRSILKLQGVRIGLVVLMVCYMAVFATSNAQAFIYFQF